MEYARQDVHHLLRLHDQLLLRIAALGAGADAALAEANRRSQAVCLSLYAKAGTRRDRARLPAQRP